MTGTDWWQAQNRGVLPKPIGFGTAWYSCTAGREGELLHEGRRWWASESARRQQSGYLVTHVEEWMVKNLIDGRPLVWV